MKLMSPADLVGKAGLDMLSEAKLSYYLFVTGRVGHVDYPSFPHATHFSPVNSTLPS